MFQGDRQPSQPADDVMKLTSTSPQETEALGRCLSRGLRPGDSVFLCGSIGAGKSVLARGIALGLGADDWKGSPTFTLVNEYDTIPPVYHVDLYRLSETEAEDIGLDEYVREDGITVIEWADRARSYLTDIARSTPIEIEIEDLGGDDRVLSVQHYRGGSPCAAAGEPP
jgi:tRNA threonylcarbamoyladenosine biosynthesis protein TsaE